MTDDPHENLFANNFAAFFKSISARKTQRNNTYNTQNHPFLFDIKPLIAWQVFLSTSKPGSF